MTTRRNLLMMMAAGAASTATGCTMAARDDQTAAVGVPDVLVARTSHGLAVIRDGGLEQAGPGAASLSGCTLCVANGGTVSLISTLSGATTASYRLAGDWMPRTVSTPGSLVALTAPGSDAVRARASTTIVFADGHGEVTRHTLAGVVEPDAFTADAAGLFVLEWLPASAPDHYRVRLLNIATGELTPLLTRDKRPIPVGAEEQMRGEGRTAVASPDRKVLYTLYTHQPGHRHTRDLLGARPGSDVHAFVHTLHLEQGWAYCVDLPEPFGSAAADAYAATLSGDGFRLYVADLAAGKLAVISTEDLAVIRVVDIPRLTGGAPAAAGARDRVFIGAGTVVTIVDRAGAPVSSWALDRPLRGMAASADRVYLGAEGLLSWRDVQGGGSGQAALSGLRSVVRVV